MRKININNKKGMLFYTLIGIMVIAMVAVLALHIINTTYVPNEADLVAQRRFNTAIYDTQADMHDVVRHALYPVIWKMGHDMDAQGVNVYISESADEMLANLTDQFAVQMNDDLCHFSENCTDNSTYYTFRQDTQDVYVGPVKNDSINITWTDDGLTIAVNMSMWANFGTKYSYRNDAVPITVEVPVRLVQMQEKAKAFNDNYARDMQTANTLALYARAILSAYTACNGTLLNQGEFTYDPVDTFLRGDTRTLEDIAKDPGNALDLGSVPAATWFDEASYLTEPSFIPPGVDAGDAIIPINRVTATLVNGFDVKDKMDQQCEILGNDTQIQECKDLNDPVILQAKAADLQEKVDTMQKAIDEINQWEDKYANTDLDCDTFKDNTTDTITKVVETIRSQDEASGVQKRGDINAQSDTNNYQDSYNPGLTELATTIRDLAAKANDLNTTQTDHLNNISNDPCNSGEDIDYSDDYKVIGCDHCSCLGYTPETCNKGTYYSCDKTLNRRYRDGEAEDCTDDVEEDGKTTEEKCDGGDCEIPQGNCLCHPSQSQLIQPIEEDLEYVKGVYNKEIQDSLNIINKTLKRAADMQASMDKVNDINNLTWGKQGYDVKSQLDYKYVRFDEGLGGSIRSWCSPNYDIKNAGVCGDRFSSITLYLLQVGVGSLVGAEGIENIFFAIYHVDVNYTISEKIIDDRDRMMLHNIYAGDDDLYGYNLTHQLFTHVAPEFVIYKDKSMSTSSEAYIPMFFPIINAMCEKCTPQCKEWGRVTDGLFSEECRIYKGVNSSVIGC